MAKYYDTAPLPIIGWSGMHWGYLWRDSHGDLMVWWCHR